MPLTKDCVEFSLIKSTPCGRMKKLEGLNTSLVRDYCDDILQKKGTRRVVDYITFDMFQTLSKFVLGEILVVSIPLQQ